MVLVGYEALPVVCLISFSIGLIMSFQGAYEMRKVGATRDVVDLIADPAACISRVCEFAGIEFDSALEARLAAPLPLSRYTQTPPAPDKWLKNADLITPVLPQLSALRARLAAEQLSPQTGSRAAG